MSKPKKSVLMAIIGSAYGIRGEVRVKSFTADPLALGTYGPLYDRAGKNYQIKLLRPQQTVVVVHFEGVDNRTQAKELNGIELFIEYIQLPDDLGDDEFYQDDLLGFTAFDANGNEIGCISAFFNFGGGDIIELAIKGGENRLIPFTKAAIPYIDMAVEQIIVDPVAAGLGRDEDHRAHEA
ncbi:MAG: 16S rRNA processing protein RimM [Candidatus Tokpelaia sp. JSC189]|nr:MAG: 16S rRNA processing protein RimM [Candidatus Tokpelaia sp. JSC189]